MYKIKKEVRDMIVNYLDKSQLPHADVKQLAAMLMKLEEIKGEKEDKDLPKEK